MADRETLLKILDLARWAPSGDNTQPWRFEIVGDGHIAVHGHDTRDWCVYDFRGHASHISHGALLETLTIAATGFRLKADWSLRQGSPNTAPVYDVKLTRNDSLSPDPLIPFIEARAVQRRPMRMQPLARDQRQALRKAVGDDYSLQFFESFRERAQVARLLWENAYLRLTCREAYEVHRDVIEWGAQYSKNKIPDQAVGVDPATAKLMRWVMQSWGRVAFFNKYLFGTVAPRLQLDLVPSIACSAHILIKPSAPLSSTLDFVHSGRAMQRLWLSAASIGLHLQPEMTPIIFRWYVRSGDRISEQEEINVAAKRLVANFELVSGNMAGDDFSFFCRVGRSSGPRSRSTRMELDDLLHSTMA